MNTTTDTLIITSKESAGHQGARRRHIRVYAADYGAAEQPRVMIALNNGDLSNSPVLTLTQLKNIIRKAEAHFAANAIVKPEVHNPAFKLARRKKTAATKPAAKRSR